MTYRRSVQILSCFGNLQNFVLRDNSSDSFYACFAIYPNPLRNWVYIHFKRGAIVLSLQDGHCRASKTVIDDGSPLCFLLDLKIMPKPEGTGGGERGSIHGNF